MRIWLAALCLAFANAAGALERARELAAAGAPRLALERVERLQPGDPGAARWGEWEAVRIGLLGKLGRTSEALARAAALPAALPAPALRQCLLAAARAALQAGRAFEARAHTARLLWQLDAPDAEARAARLLVIESYLLERRGEQAFRAMLRFDQDYRPLERETAERFVQALLELGESGHAVNWLAALPDESALKLRLRLQAGLLEPKSAVEQARAALGRGNGAGYWRVIAEAAARQDDSALTLEAYEQLVQAGAARPTAGELWTAYSAQARSLANRHGLIAGDEAAWRDLAARRLPERSPERRAMLAHLARHGAAPETRRDAQRRLVGSLDERAFGRVALRLFSDEAAPGELDAGLRYRLGVLAEAQAPALAARFWHGLPLPQGADPQAWQIRVAAAEWRAGGGQEALQRVGAALTGASVLTEAALARAVTLAEDLQAGGQPAAAASLYEALLPHARGTRAADVLFALGTLARSAQRHVAAADYFLRAALIGRSRFADAQARLAAGESLARAGYRRDARAQFEWVLARAGDGRQIDQARRALAALGAGTAPGR